MKTVFSSHAECIHTFFQFTQSNGRACNVFFDGPVLYSYGRHFELARKLSDDTLLINTQSYSVSTAKHQNIVRSAVNRHKVSRVLFIEWQREFDFKACQALHVKEANLTFWAWNNGGRKGFRALDSLFKSLDNLRALETLGAVDYSGFAFNPAEISLIYSERKEAQKAITKKANEARETAKQRTEKEKLELWLKGLFNGSFHGMQKIYLRRKGENIETTRGAKVPFIEAVAMVKDIRNGFDVTGRKIGAYQVNKVTIDNIVIGCHVIDFETVNELFQ